MSDYQRVRVTTPSGPQRRLVQEFPTENYDPDSDADSVTFIAQPSRVREFIETAGEREGWGEWVTDIAVEELSDPANLDPAFTALIEEGEPRVWDYARALIPEGGDLDEYIWSNRVPFKWDTSTVEDSMNANPATIEMLTDWIDDEYFLFDEQAANPSQNSTFGDDEGPVFDWADDLHASHPSAELRVTGALCAPRIGAPHGYGYLNGLAITMSDGVTTVPDGVVDWCKKRFWAEFDEETDSYIGGEEYIGQADEFRVNEATQNHPAWVRIWWD